MAEKEPKSTAVNRKKGVLFPFGIRLVLIVSAILLGSIWIITLLMGIMVSTEFVRNAQTTNFEINNRAAAGVRERLYKTRSEAMLLLDMSTIFWQNAQQMQQIRNIFFERNPTIAAVMVHESQEIINEPFFINNMLARERLDTWLSGESETIKDARDGVPIIKNVSPVMGINLLALFYPWQSSGRRNAAIVLFSPENLAEISGTGSSTTLVINGDGDVIVHPDFTRVLTGENIITNPLVEALRNADGESVNLDSFAIDGNRFVGAGHQIPLANAAVFSFMEYSVITEQITAVSRRNIYLSITVMFLAILITWFFSKTITGPIKKLTAAAVRIGGGEFDLDLRAKAHDETGLLTREFIRMGQNLTKFVSVTNLVGRFNNSGLLETAINGKINLDGEKVRALVLVADFVTFRESAESLDPVDALELLNQFIVKVTDQAEKTGGIVDKIIDSRVIVVWGVPSPGKNIDDIVNGVRAVLALRAQLYELNIERETNRKAPFRMNCGIHFGEVIAGRVGIAETGQYSIAGAAVREAILASEACASAETDIIVTNAVQEAGGKRLVTEKITKSKSAKDGSRYLALVNLAPANEDESKRWPFTLADVRESLGIRPAAKKAGGTKAKKAGAPDPAEAADTGNAPMPAGELDFDDGEAEIADSGDSLDFINDSDSADSLDFIETSEADDSGAPVETPVSTASDEPADAPASAEADIPSDSGVKPEPADSGDTGEAASADTVNIAETTDSPEAAGEPGPAEAPVSTPRPDSFDSPDAEHEKDAPETAQNEATDAAAEEPAPAVETAAAGGAAQSAAGTGRKSGKKRSRRKKARTDAAATAKTETTGVNAEKNDAENNKSEIPDSTGG